MQKRANSARRDLGALVYLILLIQLTILGSLAGGNPVGPQLTYYGEATVKAGTLIARHGPKGTAAVFSPASNG